MGRENLCGCDHLNALALGDPPDHFNVLTGGGGGGRETSSAALPAISEEAEIRDAARVLICTSTAGKGLQMNAQERARAKKPQGCRDRYSRGTLGL